jgi:2-polyprenyl-3-methyl-5-hydroxy-6-metoxy-1,4-benzoquinol methylase
MDMAELKDLLKDLGLIIDENPIKLPYPARDNHNVWFYRDRYTGVIYAETVDKIFDESLKPGTITDDDKRRVELFKSLIKDKEVLDYGCGHGGFYECGKDMASITNYDIGYGSEILNKRYDVVTMFHVLEHLENPLDILNQLWHCLKTGGKIIIEVPSAFDILLSIDAFIKHTLWSQHLILHTHASLRKFLERIHFVNIEVSNYQRYDFINHVKWATGKKIKAADNKFMQLYFKSLCMSGFSDTLIAVGEK